MKSLRLKLAWLLLDLAYRVGGEELDRITSSTLWDIQTRKYKGLN